MSISRPNYDVTTDMTNNLRSRWFAFRLRTLFVMVAVVAVLSWVGAQLKWIADRHVVAGECVARCTVSAGRAPWPLGVFGEPGTYYIYLHPKSRTSVEWMAKIYPEAEIGFGVVDATNRWHLDASRPCRLAEDSPLPSDLH